MYQDFDCEQLEKLWVKYVDLMPHHTVSTAKVMNCFMHIKPEVGMHLLVEETLRIIKLMKTESKLSKGSTTAITTESSGTIEPTVCIENMDDNNKSENCENIREMITNALNRVNWRLTMMDKNMENPDITNISNAETTSKKYDDIANNSPYTGFIKSYSKTAKVEYTGEWSAEDNTR
jgi:hypothetical protein